MHATQAAATAAVLIVILLALGLGWGLRRPRGLQLLAAAAADYVIVGAGPAGLQMALLLAQKKRSYVVLEQAADAASFWETYPVHRTLISFNKQVEHEEPDFQLRFDWNSLLGAERLASDRYYPDADEYLRYLRKLARPLRIAYGQRVERITPEGTVHLASGRSVQAEVVCCCTGLLPRPALPRWDGVETLSYTDLRHTPRDRFRGQRVAIVGNGNAGMESARHLAEVARYVHVFGNRPLRLASLTHYVGDVRARNLELLDHYQLKLLDALTEHDRELDRWQREGWPPVSGHDGVLRSVVAQDYDIVVECTGFVAAPVPGDDTPSGKYPDLDPLYRRSERLFVLGAAMHGRDHRRSAGGFIHGFRYLIRAVHRWLEQERHQVPWPGATARTIGELAEGLLVRLRYSSGLYLMQGELADVWTRAPGGFRCREEVPVAWADTWTDDWQLRLSFEYSSSFVGCRVLEDRRVPALREAERSNFLHPVVRLLRSGAVAHTHHVIEDIFTTWELEQYHAAPLRRFLAQHLAIPFN